MSNETFDVGAFCESIGDDAGDQVSCAMNDVSLISRFLSLCCEESRNDCSNISIRCYESVLQRELMASFRWL